MGSSHGKRVLHVFGRMDRGGAEVLAMNVFRSIRHKGIRFDFAVHTHEPCAFDEEIRTLGGQTIPHGAPSSEGMASYARDFHRTIRRHGPYAAVHSHVHFFSGVTLSVARAAGVPVRVAHSHSTGDATQALTRRAYQWSMRQLLKLNATHLLGCSRLAADSLFGVESARDPRVELLTNGIDLRPFGGLAEHRQDLQRKLGLPERGPLIGHVGRFSRVKNHAFIVKVFAAFLRLEPAATLVLVGTGELREDVERWCAEAGVSASVRFLGPRSDVPEILAACDLFLFPSLFEGLPVAMVEAQAAGLQCLVSNRVSPEVDLGAGLVSFLPLEVSADEWSQAMARLLARPPVLWSDRERAIRNAGYDIATSVARLEEIYGQGPGT